MKSSLYVGFLLYFIISISFVYAGTTGKISGIVIDSDTKEPLVGVNVIVEGTKKGASTDQDGYYSIINIPPGSYTLKFSYIGYADQIVTDVKVLIDLTSKINVQLKSNILESETVVVVAKRPIVRKDISNSQLNVEVAEIETMPVKSINQVLSLQAGIEQGTQGLIIRGGGANQTVIMVDGLSQNDERSNYPYSVVAISSVDEVQVQTGGFNAEYGQARSGIVNIVTKEGNTSRYNGSLTVRYHPPAQKHFGISIYDPYSYFNRPYFDPAVMWTGTDQGGWDDYTKRQYPGFEGWNAVSEATLRDNDPSNDLTPDGAMRLFQWYRRRNGDITKPDYVIDAGFGGPIPFINKYLGNLRFYFSYYKNQEMFVFPLSRDAYTENNGQLKLTSDLTNSMKLVFNGSYGEISSVSPYNWTVTPTGRVLRGVEEVANLTGSTNTALSIPFMPGYFSPTAIYRGFFGIKFLHTLNTNTLYEIKLQYKYSRYNTYQTELRDTTKKYEPVPGYFVDEAPYGYWGYGTTAPGGMHLGGWMNLGRDRSKNSTFTFSSALSSQFNHANLIKAGIEFVYNNFDIDSYTESPSMSTWNRTMIYQINPYRLSAYIQDKMEFEGFIANIGLRLDYSNPNTMHYILDPFDEYYGAGLGNELEDKAPKEKSKASFTLSPRLGISHPITENSKLYFNYGHFRQEPFSSYRFRLQRESNGQVTYIGDPNMVQEKTVAYEFGYEQNLFESILLKIAGYYKDVSNQAGWILYQGLNDVSYYKAANNNYQDIRGLEISLYKQMGDWITGFLNYTYDVRTSGYFGLLEYYENPTSQREYLKRNPYQSKPHPQPFARANIDLHTPDIYGPDWAGIKPLGGWRLNIIAFWKAGRYYTYNPSNLPGVVDDTKWRDRYNIDLRISKIIKLSFAKIQIYLDVTNLLNTKYMSMAGFADSQDWKNYLASLNFSWEKGDEHGDDKIGDYRAEGVEYDPLEPNPDNDPEISARNARRKESKSYIDMPNITSFTFLNPRAYTFGITISF